MSFNWRAFFLPCDAARSVRLEEVTLTDSAVNSNRFAHRFSGGPHGRQYEAFREEVCRNFCQLDIEPSVSDRLDCNVDIVQVGSLSMGDAHGFSGRFLRSRAMIADGCDDFVLINALADKIVAEQNGASVELRQSEMCLLEMNACGGVGFDYGNHFTAIRIPRRELLSLCPVAEDMLIKPLRQEPGIRTLIQRYYFLSAAAADSLDPEAQQVTARHMVDLIALLLRAGDHDTRLPLQGGAAAARLQIIQSQVAANLHDPDLSIVSIAERNRLSPKQVQRSFECAGVTFAEFVLEQRLLNARRLLGNPAGRQQKIATVAYSAGFGDLSYFNRVFRGRFGMTPSEWRDGQPS
jgi:AraC-like DNA-binding protein